ncbi:hypothetical protein ES703_15125 [subsurface metagenome]
MKQKCVVVAGKTFNLGLKELDEAVTEEAKRGLTLELNVGTTIFQTGISRPDKAFILHWTGETDISNVLFERFVGFGLQWPPIRSVACFTFREGVESLVGAPGGKGEAPSH